jgi:hypothetical protein
VLQRGKQIADLEETNDETLRMTTTPSVLLLHDGELDDVRELLEELGADYVHLRGGEIPERVDPPEKLFIATSRRATVAGEWPPVRRGPHPLTKIGIVSEDSNTLRSMLRRIGFDLLIRRPVHPYALRLLILRALFRGDERRRERRVPVGYEISYRGGIKRRKAMLVEFNTRGCRLLSDQPIRIGSRLTLDLPPEVTGGRSLQLQAKVVRSVVDGRGTRGEQYAVGLCFEKMRVGKRRQLIEILKKRVSGPLVLSEAMARASGAVSKLPAPAPARGGGSTPIAAPGSVEDRRKDPRAAFEGSVSSLDDEADLVLMGRDLSMGGMRVEPHPQLEMGKTFRLAIYGAPREEPFIIRATVVRNHGDDGVGLRFEQITGGVAARLESLVAGLPSVESLHGGEADALGSVVSRILESEA